MITNIHFHNQHKSRNKDTTLYTNYWRQKRNAWGQTEEKQLSYIMIVVKRIVWGQTEEKQLSYMITVKTCDL